MLFCIKRRGSPMIFRRAPSFEYAWSNRYDVICSMRMLFFTSSRVFSKLLVSICIVRHWCLSKLKALSITQESLEIYKKIGMRNSNPFSCRDSISRR